MTTRKPYTNRKDLEKVQSQWTKLTGLHDRNEWSAAIVRAATAAELAANFAIRREFENKSQLTPEFVSNLLRWANGIAGKLDKLLIPLTRGADYHTKIKRLKTVSERINEKRNAIAHQGEFCNLDEAQKAIEQSKEFIETLVKIYEPEFALGKTQALTILSRGTGDKLSLTRRVSGKATLA